MNNHKIKVKCSKSYLRKVNNVKKDYNERIYNHVLTHLWKLEKSFVEKWNRIEVTKDWKGQKIGGTES